MSPLVSRRPRETSLRGPLRFCRLGCAVFVLQVLLPGITSAEAFTVRGTVTDAEAGALAEARVELLPLVSAYTWGRDLLSGRVRPEPAATVRTDAAGRFALETPDGLWSVVVRARGRVPMQLDPLLVVAPVELPPLVMVRNRPVSLEVRDGGGTPVAGALVFTVTQDARGWRERVGGAWKPQSRHTVTDAEGRVVVPRREGERLRLSAMVPGGAPAERRDVESRTELEVGGGPRRVLTVRHADGAPAAGVLVGTGTNAFPSALTGAEGEAVLGFPSAESVELSFVTADGHRHRAIFPADAESFKVHLPVPRDTAGRVLDADGRAPLAGTWVWPTAEPALAVRADGHGRYALPAFKRGSYSLMAARPGYLTTTYRLGWLGEGQPPQPTLALEPAAALRGRVVDTDGIPVAGAEVRAVATTDLARRSIVSGRPPSGRSRSGTDGTFHVGQLRPGEEYALDARHPDYAPAELRVSGLEPRRTRADLRLVLGAGRTVTGRTVDLEDRPVADVEVVLDRADERPPDPRRRDRDSLFTTLSSGDGTFTFEHVPPGGADLSLTAPGFAPAVLRGFEVPAAGTQAVDLGEIRLEPAAEITGRVVDTGGRGLAEVTVRRLDDDMALDVFISRGMSPAGLPEVAASDAEGRFTVGDLRRGERFHLVLSKEGYRTGALEAVEVSETRSEVLEAVLERAASIRGRVVDAQGRVLPGAVVVAATADPAATEGAVSRIFARPSASTRSTPTGEFHLEVPTGLTHLSAAHDGYLGTRVANLSAEADREITGVELVLERGAVVEGRVTAGGEPLSGARVAIGDGAALTDADGRYRAEGVPPGRQQVLVDHPRHGLYEEWVDVPAAGRTLDLELAAGTSVSGHVLTAAGAGQGGVSVHLLSEEGRRVSGVLTDADGGFRLSGVRPGRYALEASGQGLATTFLRDLEVGAEGLAGLELRLADGVDVRGRITGLDAGQLAEVRVLAERDGEERYALVANSGDYTVENLMPGDWRVSATLPGGGKQVTVYRRLDSQDPESFLIDLDFGTGFVLTGEVWLGDTRLEGRELAGARLTLRGLDVTASRQVTCDHEGTFRIEDLEAGRYRLQVTAGRLLISHSEDFVLAGDHHLRIELGASRLAGRVSDAASGASLGDARVILERQAEGAGAFQVGVPSDGEGHFVVPRLTSGTYRLRVERNGYAAHDATLAVRAGEDRDDLEVALEPVGGVEVTVRLSSGAVPPRVSIGLLDGEGGTRTIVRRMLDSAGRTRIDTLPPGTWDLVVSAPGAATTVLRAELGDRPLEVVLEPACRIDVFLPELSASKRLARLELRDASGLPFRDLGDYGRLTSSFPVVAGSAELNAVPPGDWSLRITDAEGEVWSREVVTVAGQTTRVRFE